jgi:hypothetical protein
MSESIIQIEREWRLLLKEYQYVGELALTKEEVQEFGKLLGKEILYDHYLGAGAVLVTVATNCAYHEYDEQGFWLHFFGILNIEENNVLKQTIGERIESWLFENGFIQDIREGSFRFVGPILRQSGITKKYLQKFSEFMQQWGRTYTWHRLEDIDYETYKSLVPDEGASKYLLSFLRDKYGWEFTRDVARGMQQLTSGLVSPEDLAASKGYRPGFWEYFLKELGETRARKGVISKTNVPLPLLKFLVDLGDIALVFDHEYVKKRAYRIGSKTLDDPILPLHDMGLFKEKISIFIKTEEGAEIRREISGWDPKVTDYAIFSGDTGCYVSSPSRTLAGTCHVILPDNIQPPNELVIDHLGPVQIGSTKYRGWSIDVKSPSDLAFLPGGPPPQLGQEFPKLSWINTDGLRLGQSDLYEIFVGHPPKLRIENPQMIHESSLILTLNVNGRKEALRLPAIDGPILLNIDVPTPSRGEIGLELVGRNQKLSENPSLNERLYFCVIPDCSIDWPKGLFHYKDKPTVKLITCGEVSLNLFDCNRSNLDSNLWEIPERVDFVRGEINSGSVTVNVSKRIHRADLTRVSNPQDRLIERDELIDGIELIAKGYPGNTIRVALISSRGKVTRLADLGKSDISGSFHFNSKVFSDSIGAFPDPVGSFTVDYNGCPIASPTLFHDEKKIRSRFLSTFVDRSWYNSDFEPLSESLDRIVDVLNGQIDDFSLTICNVFPQGLAKWFRKLLVGLAIVENKRLDVDTVDNALKFYKSTDPDFFTAMTWFKNAGQFFDTAEDGGELLSVVDANHLKTQRKEFVLPDWVETKWSDLFAKVERRLSEYVELEDLLSEWRLHVIGDDNHSRLCDNYSGGEPLKAAWTFYWSADFNKAFKYAVRASDDHPKSPLKELALIVKGLAALRKCLFDGAESELPESAHSKLIPYLETTNYLSRLFRGLNVERLPLTMDGSIDTSYLPIRTEDMGLLSRDFLRPENPLRSQRSAQYGDWLMTLARYCHARLVSDKDSCHEAEKGLQDVIAKGDLRGGIIKKILEQKDYARL